MSKFVINEYGNNKEILRVADHFVSVPVTVSDEGIDAVNGRKIVKAGTIIGGKNKSIFEDKQELVVSKNTALLGASADGILLNDVDVTHGPNAGSCVIHGFINSSKLDEQPVSEAVEALKQIQFL